MNVEKKRLVRSLLCFLCAGALMMTSGCLLIKMTAPMHILPDGRAFPKKPKFTVMPRPAQSGSLLSYDSVYVYMREWEYENRTYTNYFYLRFWPSGECLEKVSTSELSQNEFDTFTIWGDGYSMGFYNVINSNLVVEIYVPDSYNRLYGVVCSNEIRISRVDLKYAAARFTTSTQVDYHYKRYPNIQLKAQPDWSPTGMLLKAGSKGVGGHKGQP